MSVNLYNEWEKLNKVIIGRVQSINDSLVQNLMVKNKKIKHIEQKYIDETNEDRENIISLFKEFNIEVIEIPFYTASYLSKLNKFIKHIPVYPNSPRDLNFILGNTIVECNPNKIEYFFQNKIQYDIYKELFINTDTKWIQMPSSVEFKQIHNTDLLFKSEEYLKNFNNFTEEDVIQIDGANILLCGKDVFVNVSTNSNILGYKWLEKIFPEFNFHPMSIAHDHIDASIHILKPGVLFLHSGFIDRWQDILPKQFHNWDKIFYKKEKLIFDKNSFTKGITDINVLNIDEENVLVYDFIYNEIKDDFRKYNIEPIPVQLRHHDLWLGGLHCITSDVHRNGKIEEYF